MTCRICREDQCGPTCRKKMSVAEQLEMLHTLMAGRVDRSPEMMSKMADDNNLRGAAAYIRSTGLTASSSDI